MFKILKEFLKIHIFERTRLYLIKITRQVSVKRKEIVLDTKRKFLFNTQYIWAFSELEFMSAAQLREEGHEIIIIICDKLPYNFFYINIIKKLFPESKIIYCSRDPMDNCFSLYKTRFNINSHQYSYIT